jgi:predicted double-glycine peptidase
MNYYLNIDFYNLKSSDLNNGVVLEKFKTLQQKTDYTCGPCCVQMVLLMLMKKVFPYY